MTDRPAQDPNELFDVIDTTGAPTGVVKRRVDVHRDGDWHRAIHVWIYGRDDAGAFVLLQRRGLDKDSWPGRLDAPAAGHLASGETSEDAFREVEEELGIVPDARLLRHAGTRVIAEEEPDRTDREFEEVYLLRDDRPLADYRPDPVEVDALARLPLEGWLAMLFGEAETVEATVLDAASRKMGSLIVTAGQLVPTPDRYFARVAVACHRALTGEHYIVV